MSVISVGLDATTDSTSLQAWTMREQSTLCGNDAMHDECGAGCCNPKRTSCAADRADSALLSLSVPLAVAIVDAATVPG